MKIHFLRIVALALIFGSPLQLHAQTSSRDADMQRRHMREYQRYQRHYEEQLEKFREELLEKDENLQFLYSGFIDSERIYLEVSDAYEKLLLKKMALRPDAKIIQDAIAKLQKTLRKPGQNPAYYKQQLTHMRAAQINLGRLRESLKEDEEVKLAFDEMDALEKKYLADSEKYENLMAKALAKRPEAKKNQENLDKPFAEFVREKTRQLQPKR